MKQVAVLWVSMVSEVSTKFLEYLLQMLKLAEIETPLFLHLVLPQEHFVRLYQSQSMVKVHLTAMNV